MAKVVRMKDAGLSKEDVKRRNLEYYGYKIKKYRAAAGWTADELADRLGVTLGAVRNWECGLARPDPDCLYEIFTLLDVSPNEFFGIQGVGTFLSEKERGVIGHFRAMDPRGQDDYLALGAALADRCHTLKLQEARSRIVSLPFYGRYASAGAGDYWPSDTAEAEEILLYRNPPVSEADEIIIVSGRSMEPDYHDHDRILVRHCTAAEVGHVYVFSLRGLGCVIKEAAPDRLHSLNADYEDILPWEDDGAELIGRVLGVVDASMYPSAEETQLYYEAINTLED